MKKGSLLKRCLSWVMAIAILISVAAPASAAVAALGEETYGYVALGDAMTKGVGLDNPEEEAYYAQVAKYLGTGFKAVSEKRYRIEEFRYLLDDDYAGDGYTKSFGGINTDRKAGTVKDYVKNAEVITLNVGLNNFSTYIVEQMVYYLENKGAVKYSYSFDAFGDSQVQDAMENIKNVVKDRLLAAAPDSLDDAIELIDFIAEVSTYSYLSYVTSFNEVVREIYSLNPDVELYVIGIYNAMAGEVLTADVESRTITVPIGEAFGALVELANVYTQVLAPRAFDYIYVDPGTPELLIDQMGNTALKPEDRIPSALKLELLNSVEDTAISMIKEMFSEYGVTKTDKEAFAIAEEIFEKNSSDRRDYIKSLIQEFAVEEVIDRFQEELQNVASTYGSITVTEEQIKTLLDNLEAATTENDRKEVATEFVVDLMTKAMVGQTFAGIEINTQADAYEALERLERNAGGDPDALREAAADMIMIKVGTNGLKDFIDRNDVLKLLEQLDTTTSDAQREVIIDEWMNDLAVKKIAAKIQTINPSYKEADAKALLAAMAGAPEADREAIAKNHLLTTGGFHNYMVTKFAETYDENGLTLQTYGSFDAFVTAVEAAPNNDAAKAIVRTEIRLAAAKEVEADSQFQSLMSGVDVVSWFVAAENADDVYNCLFNLVCAHFNADPNNLNATQRQIITYLTNLFKSAFDAYNSAATAAEAAFTEYRDGVDTAAEGFAQYVSLKDTAAQQILDAYNQQYQGAGETALKYYADYLKLRDGAVDKVMTGYAEYDRAINLGLDTVDQFNETFDNVFAQLRAIAEVDSISLNHLVAVAQKMDADYIKSMVENLIQGDPLAAEDKTVAYIALRYYLASAMMIMPSAKGHKTIANQIITAIKTGKHVNSDAGELANMVINLGVDIYHIAKDLVSLPTDGSGQVGTLVNPNTYVAFGDNVTSGTALSDPSLAYPQLIGNALAMDYINADMDEVDNVYNCALNGMRAEELLMLLNASYSGDAYTEARFGVEYMEDLRAEYLEYVKQADLITINVGINNLTTFPLEQIMLAYNGEETYEMDWARYIGQSRYQKISSGKNAVMDLLLGIVDTAESRKPVLDDLNAYEKAERALETTFTAIESLLYGLIGYAANLDAAVEAAATLNPNATIVLVGFYNPMEGTYVRIDKTAEIKDHELDLSQFTINVSALFDKIVNVSNRYLTNYVGDVAGGNTAADKGSRIVSVPILDTTLGVTDTGASKDLSTLTTVTVTIKGREVKLLVPEYFVEAGKNVGVNLHPNATGHAYIASQVLNALKFKINATVWLQDSWKYYGEEDPDFTYLIDDLSSLYNAIDVEITREPGEAIGHYEINATVTFSGYNKVDIKVADFEIKARPVTVTVMPAYTEIEKGQAIPEYTAVVTDEDENVITGLNPVISGVPADSNTVGTYTIKAELDAYGYEVVEYNYATLVIGEKTKTPVYLRVVLSDDTIEYGDDLPTASVEVTDANGNVLTGVDATVSGMPAANCGSGTYTITAVLNDTENYEVRSVTNATLTVAPRQVTITIDPDYREIEKGGTIPTYTATVTDRYGYEIDIDVEWDGIPANSNTTGTYTITADLDDEDYKVVNVLEATLVIKAPADYVCQNTRTGVKYEVVQLAVLDAQPGDTIIMLKNSDQTAADKLALYHDAGTVNLVNGVTLNLDEYKLTLDALYAAEGNYVTATYETAANAGGRLVLPKENLILREGAADGTYTVLPFWMPNEGCYVFDVFTIFDNNTAKRGVKIDVENDNVTFQLKHATHGYLNGGFIADNGVQDNGISIRVYLQWETGTGTSYQYFVFNEQTVMNVTGGRDYQYVLTNFSQLSINVETLKVTAQIVTEAGAIAEGHTWDLNGIVEEETSSDSNIDGVPEVQYTFESASGANFYNENQNTYYEMLHKAVQEANPGDVIVMLGNSDQTDSYYKEQCAGAGVINLSKNITLNLNGYALKVDALIVGKGSCVTGTYETAAGIGGRLVVPENNFVLMEGAADGTYTVLPFWMPNEGCYVFDVFTIFDNNTANRGVKIDVENDKVIFQLKHATHGYLNGGFIADNGVQDNRISIQVYLQWETGTGMSYQYFVFNEQTVMNVTGGRDYQYVLTNFSQLSIDANTLVVTSRIVSSSGAAANGNSYTTANDKIN